MDDVAGGHDGDVADTALLLIGQAADLLTRKRAMHVLKAALKSIECIANREGLVLCADVIAWDAGLCTQLQVPQTRL